MSSRRDFLRVSALAALGMTARKRAVRAEAATAGKERTLAAPTARSETLKLFLCGDVMTGRGIDQILAQPSDPRLHEPWAQSALDYVELAERTHGPLPRSVAPEYVWGAALDYLQRAAPDLRIINLETSVTTSDDWQRKGINYRMHPANVDCLNAAGVDCCVLANNHVLDWGSRGLTETLATLRRAGLATAGAGRNRAEAEAPAELEVPGAGRVRVWAWGSATAGIPADWGARRDRPGVALLPDLTPATARRIGAEVRRTRGRRDLVVVSLHWGGNWGYDVPSAQREFARILIAEGGVDLVHGHSSHHPRGIEVIRGRPILYGCGDFLNDYEGIRGHERFRGDLVLGYLVTFDLEARRLAGLEMIPFRIRRFRLEPATAEQTRWLAATLDRECRRLGDLRIEAAEGKLVARLPEAGARDHAGAR